MSNVQHEAERLQLLRSLEILDTPPEQVFDRITRVLASTLGVPIALVSLVDEHRQWFKSRVGLDVQETPRDAAFCVHAIGGSGTLVVEDARTDVRFRDNPLVVGAPHIRFYAGTPIRTREGFALGTLCAIDDRPGSSPTNSAGCWKTWPPWSPASSTCARRPSTRGAWPVRPKAASRCCSSVSAPASPWSAPKGAGCGSTRR